MRTSEAAGAYARALFDLASLAGSVDTTDESMAAVVTAVRGNVDLRDALVSAGVPAEKKREVLRDLFGPSVTPEALAVTSSVVERGQVALLGDVAAAYRDIAQKERGVVVVEVTTAIPLDERLRASVSGKLEDALGHPVSLRESVDPSIVGGIIIGVSGRVLDGSVSSQLEGMRKTLASVSAGGDQ